MAGIDSHFTPYLTSNQQDLLRAALASNRPSFDNTREPSSHTKQALSAPKQPAQMLQTNSDGNMFASPQQLLGSGSLGTFDIDNTPFLDSLDGDNSFDFESGQVDGQDMFGSIPDSAANAADSPEKHMKRKNSSDQDDEDEDPDSKRREGDDKIAKKPGRKPITTEPTTVCHLPFLVANAAVADKFTETKGSKSRGSKSIPRSKRTASERPRDQGRRAYKDHRG